MSSFRRQPSARIRRSVGPGQLSADLFATLLPAPVRFAPQAAAVVAAPAPVAAAPSTPALELVPSLPAAPAATPVRDELVALGAGDGIFRVDLMVDGGIESVEGPAPSARVARLDAAAPGEVPVAVWALGAGAPVLVWEASDEAVRAAFAA